MDNVADLLMMIALVGAAALFLSLGDIIANFITERNEKQQEAERKLWRKFVEEEKKAGR